VITLKRSLEFFESNDSKVRVKSSKFRLICASLLGVLGSIMRCEVEILNSLGLHARPAAEFVKTARQFDSKISVCKGNAVFSARSILDLLSADLGCGTKCVLEAEGVDAEAALVRLKALLVELAAKDC
jgi:phosphocarrier protein